jgi:hypothetical protein
MATNTLLAEAVDEASMAEASRDEASVKQLMKVSVEAAEQNGGAVALTDHGLKARQVLLLREPLSGWAASVVVTLDLSRNKLRDRGAAAVAEVLAGSATIERLELEHNGIGDVGATSLAAMLRIHPVLHSLNMRRNLLTDTGARALVVAMYEVPRIQHLDITKNKHVTHSMAEAARLAAETNRVRQKALAALDKLATLYESVGVIKGELGFAANMPLIGALQQACAVLGVGFPPGEEEGEEHDGDGGGDGDEGKEAGDLQTAAGGGGDDEQSSPAETRPSTKKPWLTEQAAAVLFELDRQMVEVAAQDCGDPVIRSLALGYTAQPAEVAELDAIARRAGVKMSDVLGFARAQQEAERALAKADVDPVMEDESARRRRLKKAIRAAEAEANRPAPTVLEQLAEILELAVQRGLLTSVAASKIRERVHAGRLQPATTLVQWTKKLRDVGSYPDGSAGGAQQQQGDRPSEPIWRAVHDERSGNTYYYNRVTRETTWTRPPSLAPDRQQPANVAEEKTQQHGDGGEEDSDGDDRLAFEEWNFSPPRQVRPGQQSQPQLPPAASSSVEWAQEEPASEDEDRMPARQSGAAGFAVDDVVVEITADESRKLPFRECEDGRVEIARVSQKAQEFGLRVGMLLHSLAAVGGGERQPVGMLSYGGVMDQIRCMARAGGGLTLGFVRRPPSQPVRAAPTDVPTLQPALQLQHQQAAAAAQARQRGATLPQPGDRYVVEFRDGAMLRAGSEMESAAAGRLSYGQVVTVLESRVNQIGIVRLRVDGGWASVRASDGTVLMRKAPYGLDGAVTTLAPSAQFGIGGGADLDFDEDADVGMLLPPPAPPRTAAQKAAALVERALEHDTAEEVADAISCYQRAAKLLKLAAKEKCSRTQVAYYRSKGAEYIARAEELSELVAEQRRRDAERQQLRAHHVTCDATRTSCCCPASDLCWSLSVSHAGSSFLNVVTRVWICARQLRKQRSSWRLRHTHSATV